MKKQSGRYVDGFVFTLPKKNLPAYIAMAKKAGKLWKKYGALDYKECIGEDVRPKMPAGMKHLIFPTLTKAKPTEAIGFSYIVYKSRKHRDQVNAKVMSDPIMNDPKQFPMPMPFDPKNMCSGGFSVVVDESAD